MEEKPYKFDNHNHRLVTNIQKPTTVYYLSAALFVASLYGYQRRIFRVDQNSLNFALFTAGSALASY